MTRERSIVHVADDCFLMFRYHYLWRKIRSLLQRTAVQYNVL